MCMMVYAGADARLPEIALNKKVGGMYVVPEKSKKVAKTLGKPNVYYVGGHGGCGCSFDTSEDASLGESESEDERLDREDVRQLFAYVRRAAGSVPGGIRLLVCWAGEEGASIVAKPLPADELCARDAWSKLTERAGDEPVLVAVTIR